MLTSESAYPALNETHNKRQKQISVVIPAHQEEHRISPTLRTLVAYLSENFSDSEVVVVCNACTDNTASVAASIETPSNCTIRVLSMPQPGKGRAVKSGVLSSNSEVVFFMDADSAYEPSLITGFYQELRSGADVVIAEREKTQKYRSRLRRALGSMTGTMMSAMLTPGITDTQAGFKGFSRAAAEVIFYKLEANGFSFDIEVLMFAARYNFKIRKMVVQWNDCEGTTVRVFRDYVRALGSLALTIGRVQWDRVKSFRRTESLNMLSKPELEELVIR